MFDRLRNLRLRARPSKCTIGESVVDFAGHRVGRNSIKPRDALIDQFPRPKKKKQVRSFLGLIGYYRRFIKNFAEIAVPLKNLTKKGEPTRVSWTNACEYSFIKLKSFLKSPPVLRPPHWDNLFILQVDASSCGVGAILSQLDGEGLQHPIVFASVGSCRNEVINNREGVFSSSGSLETYRYITCSEEGLSYKLIITRSYG